MKDITWKQDSINLSQRPDVGSKEFLKSIQSITFGDQGIANPSKLYHKHSVPIKKRVRDLTPEDCKGVRRAGCLIYRVYDDNIYFLVAIDNASKQITDPGGTYNRYVDKDKVDTALRELTEETLGVIGPISKEDIQNCWCIIVNRMMIILIHMAVKVDKLIAEYKKEAIMCSPNELENMTIAFISFRELVKLINDDHIYKMYTVVRDFFLNAGDFRTLL